MHCSLFHQDAHLYSRLLAGVITDWFALHCTVIHCNINTQYWFTLHCKLYCTVLCRSVQLDALFSSWLLSGVITYPDLRCTVIHKHKLFFNCTGTQSISMHYVALILLIGSHQLHCCIDLRCTVIFYTVLYCTAAWCSMQFGRKGLLAEQRKTRFHSTVQACFVDENPRWDCMEIHWCRGEHKPRLLRIVHITLIVWMRLRRWAWRWSHITRLCIYTNTLTHKHTNTYTPTHTHSHMTTYLLSSRKRLSLGMFP